MKVKRPFRILVVVIGFAGLFLAALATAPLFAWGWTSPDHENVSVSASTPAPPAVIRRDAVNDLGQIVPLPAPVETTAQPADVQGFTMVTVTLEVQDKGGVAVENALVKAFSEDWGVRYPFDWGDFYTTDEQGRVNCRIPAGDWTFFAAGGDAYKWSRPGHGLLALLSTTVSASTTLILQPDSTLTVTLRDVDGNVLEADDVYLMESDHIPRVPFPITGQTQGGQIVLHSQSGMQYDLLLLKRPDSTPGYFLHYTRQPAAGTLDLRPTRSDLALVHFRAYDRLDQPTTLNVGVSIPWLDMDRMHGFFNFNVTGQADFYVTPQWIRLNYRNLSTPDWYYFFVGKYYDLQPGSEITYSMGGPASADVKALGKQTDTQLWLPVVDAFDNQMDFFSSPGGTCSIPITLTHHGATIYTDTFSGLTGRVEQGYTQADSPEYQIDLDLGPPYGSFSLTGTLLSPEAAYGWEVTSSSHFDLHTPYDFSTQTAGLSTELESAYDHLSDYLGEELSGKITAYIEPHPSSAGWGGTNVMQAWFGGFRWHHPQRPAQIFESVVWHELGHVFQFTDPLHHGVECPWFCEPWATYLGCEVIEALQGEQLAGWHRSNHVDFFKYIDGGEASEVERMQFILFYLREVFGPNIHRDFTHWWADGSYPPARQALESAGFGDRQIVTVLYSYLAEQNLGWLFRMGGAGISDAEVEEGLDIIDQVVTPDEYGFLVDGKADEWTDEIPAAVDPTGDSVCSAGTDLTSFYYASTPQYLYIMQEVADNSAGEGWFHFHIDKAGGSVQHYVLDLTSSSCTLYDEDTWAEIGHPLGAADEVAEVAIPWSMLESPQQVELWPVAPGGPRCDAFSSHIDILGPDFVIDGRGDDWSGETPAAVDPAGDSVCGAGTDLTNVYYASTPEHLYIMQEVADNRAGDGWFHFHIDKSGGTIQHYVLDLTSSSCTLYEEGTWTEIGHPPGAVDEVAEVAIPWSMLESPQQVELWPVAPGTTQCDSFSSSIVISRGCPGGWDVSNVRLNGGGTNITVNPGDPVRLQYDYEVWNDADYPSAVRQVLAGLVNDSWSQIINDCAYDGIPATCPSKTSGSFDHTFTASTDPGTYQVVFAGDTQYNCTDAKARFPQNNENQVIGTITVDGGDGNTVYLEPQHSSTSFGNTTRVAIKVDAANFKSGQIKLNYGLSCVDVTDWDRNSLTFSTGTWEYRLVHSQVWITFSAEDSLSGIYTIGWLTLRCESEDPCTRTLDFLVDGTETSKLFDDWGSEVPATWQDGTFECSSCLCGDVAPYPGCDGQINMGDVSLLHSYVGHPGQYSLCCESAGDVAPYPSCDGQINMGDVSLLHSYVGHPGQYSLCCEAGASSTSAPAVPAAADDEVTFVPRDSNAPIDGTTEVEIQVDATNFKSGQVKFTYDATCADVTDWDRNTSDFAMGTWESGTSGEEWITFSAEDPVTGTYSIGTLTIHSVSEGLCTTELDFIEDGSMTSKLFDDWGSEISAAWQDGRFRGGYGVYLPIVVKNRG